MGLDNFLIQHSYLDVFSIIYTGGLPLSMICGTWKKLYYAKFVLVEYRLNSTSTNLLIRNSTSMNFIPIALKFVLVEFILVETVLVGDPLYFFGPK